MKLILLFLSLIYITKGFELNPDINIVNEYFYINFDENSIILNNYYKPLVNDNSIVKINFDYILEENENDTDVYEYNKQNILFNSFIKETDSYSGFENLKTLMKNDNIYFEVNYETYTFNKYVDVYMIIQKINKNNNKNIICISFDKKVINYDGEYTLEVSDYNIKFSNTSFLNGKYNKVIIERFGNYFYIHLPSFEDYIYYNFKIQFDTIYKYIDLIERFNLY